MNTISFLSFSLSHSSEFLQKSLSGWLNGREVVKITEDVISKGRLSDTPSYFNGAFKAFICFILGISCFILIYRHLSCKQSAEAHDQPHDTSPVSSKVVCEKRTPSPRIQEERSPSPKVLEVAKEMPLLGFGTFIGIEHKKIVDLVQRQKVVEQSILDALQAGCRHLDCASNYQNLEWVGNALKKAFQSESEGGLGLKREDVWVTSKDAHPSAENLEKTLKALGLDYLDLYLIHYPHQHIEAIWKDMNALADRGLAKNIGVSNFYRPQMEKLLKICEEHSLRSPYADEMEISPWVQENEFHDYCKQRNIRLIAYSPLGYGNSAALLETVQLTEKAKQLDATAAQVALAWNMARGITVIPSSRNKEHIQSNCASQEFVEALAQDEDFMESIKAVDMNLCSTTTAEHFKNDI